MIHQCEKVSGQKDFPVTTAGGLLGGTFRLILVKHVETAMYKTRCM